MGLFKSQKEIKRQMKILNYDLSGGSITLLANVQAVNSDIVFQVWYSGINNEGTRIHVGVSTIEGGPFAEITEATKVLASTGETQIIALSGLSFCFLEFFLEAGGTVGTISKIDCLGLSRQVK